MRDEVKGNRELWDALTPVHVKSKFYDLEGFKQGRCSLNPLEVEEVGDVRGKNLLHLQCHFGMDTLSWARRGAKVTGMDFSLPSIEKAKALAAELNLDANFICSDLYDLPEQLKETFDIVFTTGGVLCWLPDLAAWGRVIAKMLKPGGLFYLREFHPFQYCLDDREGVSEARVHYPYFHDGEPLRFPGGEDSDYADPETVVNKDSHEWPYALSNVITALLEAGLTLETFREFPWTTYQALPILKEDADGRWVLPDYPGGFPLMFSLKARR